MDGFNTYCREDAEISIYEQLLREAKQGCNKRSVVSNIHQNEKLGFITNEMRSYLLRTLSCIDGKQRFR